MDEEWKSICCLLVSVGDIEDCDRKSCSLCQLDGDVSQQHAGACSLFNGNSWPNM